MLAPAGTPAPIVRKLNAALREALNSDRSRRRSPTKARFPYPGAPEDYARDIDREETKWAKVIRSPEPYQSETPSPLTGPRRSILIVARTCRGGGGRGEM